MLEQFVSNGYISSDKAIEKAKQFRDNGYLVLSIEHTWVPVAGASHKEPGYIITIDKDGPSEGLSPIPDIVDLL